MAKSVSAQMCKGKKEWRDTTVPQRIYGSDKEMATHIQLNDFVPCIAMPEILNALHYVRGMFVTERARI